MNNNDILSYFKKGKLIQLITVVIIAIAFFLSLALHDDLRYNIYTNRSIFILCAFVWFLLLLIFFSLFFDFYKLNYFNKEANTYKLKKYLDDSNQILNRFSSDNIFKLQEVNQILPNVGCLMFEISNLHEINQTYTHDTGDEIITAFSNILESIGNQFGIVIRNSGNEYLIVVAECTTETVDKCLDLINKTLVKHNSNKKNHEISINYTTVLNSEKHFTSFSELLASAHHQLHK